jgi:biopolymer transport protein TolR
MVRESGELRVRTRNAGESLERTVALREIGEAVREVGGQNMPVVISGDKGVRYESIVNVMDQLQRANIGRVALMVKPSGN